MSRMNCGVTPWNAKRQQHFGGDAGQLLGLDRLRELQRHVVDRHRELHFVIDAGEPERAHCLRKLRIGDKAENTCAFTVLDVTLAVDAAGVSRDVEFYVVFAGRGEIEALKFADSPIRLALRVTPVAAIDEAELHFSRLRRSADGPVALEFFAGARGRRESAEHQRYQQQDLRLHHSTSASLS
jgi:hypothetical protein